MPDPAARPPFCLTLRSSIVARNTVLHDELTGATYPLNRIGAAIVGFLRRPATVARIIAVLAAEKAFHQSDTERELRQMLLLGFFEQTGDTYRERLRGLRNDELPSVEAIEGSRFGCQGSGECCRGYLFGYVGEAEKARIEALVTGNAFTHGSDGPLFIEDRPGMGAPVYRLATRGDRCVFLDERHRCSLHRAFGAEAKPAFCRLYPLAAVKTIDGIRIYDRGECATFAISAHTGPPLADQAAAVRALADAEPFHPVTTLHEAWRCDYGAILALSRRMDAELSERPPLQALFVIGLVARRFIVMLTRCPIEAGQPETAVATALGGDVTSSSSAALARNARRGLETLAALADAMAERVSRAERLGAAFGQAALVLADICRDALAVRTLSPSRAGALAATLPADSEIWMRVSLRHQVFGRELLLDNQLPAGLLRMTFATLLTFAGARLRACEAGSGSVSVQHFNAAHMTARRMLHRPGPHAVLRENGGHVWPILDALPRLAVYLGSPADGIVTPAG